MFRHHKVQARIGGTAYEDTPNKIRQDDGQKNGKFRLTGLHTQHVGTRSKRAENPIVFLDLSIGGTAARLTFELRKDIAPLTVENFRLLCTGDRGTHNGGTPLSYLGCIFHRVVKDFAVMGGDIANQDGTGRLSVYGEPFVDENFILWHVGPGVLTCCNAGPNTNTSAFMITTVEAPWLNGHCVVFGCLADAASFEALDKMEACGTEGGRPSVDIQVTACGQLFPF